MLGNTAVVRTRSKFKVRINDLERLEKKDDFVTIFPEIIRLREEDILLVREVIDRSKKYAGREQELLLSETRAKIEQIIGKAQENMDDLTYLAKVVKEYVMMTR